MIKVLLVSASFLFAALSAGLLLQYQTNIEPDYADVFDVTDISYVSAPVETLLPAENTSPPRAFELTAENTNSVSATRPRNRPSQAPQAAAPAAPNAYRAGTLAVLSTLNGGTPVATEGASPEQATSVDDLQMLIARSLARNDTASYDTTDAYIANLNTEAQDTRTLPAQDQVAFVNTLISDSPRAATSVASTASAADAAYLAQLNEANAPPKRVLAATNYTVKRGDNLAKISYIHYGRTSDYVVIFQANRQSLSSPDHIMVGQRLVIPAL